MTSFTHILPTWIANGHVEYWSTHTWRCITLSILHHWCQSYSGMYANPMSKDYPFTSGLSFYFHSSGNPSTWHSMYCWSTIQYVQRQWMQSHGNFLHPQYHSVSRIISEVKLIQVMFKPQHVHVKTLIPWQHVNNDEYETAGIIKYITNHTIQWSVISTVYILTWHWWCDHINVQSI